MKRLAAPMLIAITTAVLLLAGCGQKGNLYLPNQKKKVPASQPRPDTQAQPDTTRSAPPSGAQ
jgi:predicted small lipoprotein YifL